jgi:hypothetical protein
VAQFWEVRFCRVNDCSGEAEMVLKSEGLAAQALDSAHLCLPVSIAASEPLPGHR